MHKLNKIEITDTVMASIHDFSKSPKGSNPGGTGGSGGTGGTGGSTGAFNQTLGSNLPFINAFDDDEDDGKELLINYNEHAKNGKFTEALFRDSQIEQILSILNTINKPNALITGNAGVGKTQIVEEIARRLVNDDPLTCDVLKGMTIYELPLSNIVSGSSFVGQVEQKIKGVIKFASNKKNKAIIFIDEIHQIMSESGSNSTYDKIAQILKPALGRGAFRTIGATTTQEAKSFMGDPAFSRRWTDVGIPELSIEQSYEILQNLKLNFEKHHNVLILNDTLKQVVSMGDEYKRYGSHRPDSSITLMDKAMSDTRITRYKMNEQSKTDPIIKQFIISNPRPIVDTEQLKKSALTLLTGDDKMYDQNTPKLISALDNNIIGQTEAKSQIIDAIKRLGLRLTKRQKPVSFLLAGPSGTGKTEITKHVVESVFGSKDRMIYINMSEYSNPSSLNRLIGSPAGFVGSDSKRELPFDSLEHNPYQVILLDEFEKAHTDVQRLFMQALDEGIIKTSRNKEIDFKRTLIFATTNAGVEEMSSNPIGFSDDKETHQHSTNDIMNMLKGSFDTELINRFEKVIAFTAISKEDYTKILAVKYNKLIKEVISNRGDLDITPDHIDISNANGNVILDTLSNESYNAISNGRPAEKTIRAYIEDTIIAKPNDTQFNFL